MKFAFLTIILLWILIEPCSAQIPSTKDLDLNAIKRIEFVKIPGDGSGRRLEYRIERDRPNIWVSKRIDTVSKVIAAIYEVSKEPFIREIPESYLSSLLNSFTNPTLTKNIAHFEISQDNLISYLDSISIPLSNDKKLAIVKDIKNKFHLQKYSKCYLYRMGC